MWDGLWPVGLIPDYVAKEGGLGMHESSVTKSGYLRQIFGSIRKHRGEPILAMVCLIAIAVVYIWAGATLHLQASDATPNSAIGLIGSLLPFVMAFVLLQFAVAAWRLYRNQQISITTKQTLLDLDEVDRAQSEQNLRAHYANREQRLEQRYEAQVKRLNDNIVALTPSRGGQK
jgi:hypothetical protein